MAAGRDHRSALHSHGAASGGTMVELIDEA
jgi:hypothetical protein